jgi:hypothetical protein
MHTSAGLQTLPWSLHAVAAFFGPTNTHSGNSYPPVPFGSAGHVGTRHAGAALAHIGKPEIRKSPKLIAHASPIIFMAPSVVANRCRRNLLRLQVLTWILHMNGELARIFALFRRSGKTGGWRDPTPAPPHKGEGKR